MFRGLQIVEIFKQKLENKIAHSYIKVEFSDAEKLS